MTQIRQVAAHLQCKDRHRQRGADPEALRHVAQLGALALLGGGQHGLERHAADGAAPRSHLAHLRVHRAGVLDLARVASRAGLRLRRCVDVMAVVVVAVPRVVVVSALHHRAVGHHVGALGRMGVMRVIVVRAAAVRHGALLLSLPVLTLSQWEGQGRAFERRRRPQSTGRERPSRPSIARTMPALTRGVARPNDRGGPSGSCRGRGRVPRQPAAAGHGRAATPAASVPRRRQARRLPFTWPIRRPSRDREARHSCHGGGVRSLGCPRSRWPVCPCPWKKCISGHASRTR